MKFDRLGDITSELSSNLVKSIVLPENFLKWLSKPLAERLREKQKAVAGTVRPVELVDIQAATLLDGPMVLFGGAPAPDEAIVAFMHLAGSRAARVAVIPVAASNPDLAVESGLRLFTRFGMRNAEVLSLITRERAESPEWAAKLASYDGVLLCGDQPELGIKVLRGSVAHQTLKEMMTAGKPLAGLGAGAALFGDRVLVNQDGQEAILEGLGLAPGLLVESGFTQKACFSRLAKALGTDQASQLMGMGLDAGAAVVIRNAEAKVLGDTSVTFLDPREKASDDPTMCGLKVHVLLDGYDMHLRTRKPMNPAKETVQAASDR